MCVFELGTGRPHACARACLSPGTGALICARAGLRLSLGQLARICVCVLSLGQVVRTLSRARVFELGAARTDMCVGLRFSLGQVTRICVRACVCLSLVQVARVSVCVCLSSGQAAHTRARARVCVLRVCFSSGQGRTDMYICLRLSLGNVARMCVCLFEFGTGRTGMCVCACAFELRTGHTQARAHV